MRHPSHYYIRYLMAASWGDMDNPLTREAVNVSLKDLGIPELLVEQWDLLTGTFQAPDVFHFTNRNHATTAAFMKQEGIYSIWNPNADMKRVLLEMVGDRGDRSYQHKVHLLLMGDVPSAVIADKISKRYRLRRSLTEGMIDFYRHYFWLKSALTENEWKVYLKAADHGNYNAFMASLLCGEQQALFRAGFTPKYDYKRSLRDAHRQMSFRVQYLAYQEDDPWAIELLISLSREVRALYDKLYGEGGGYEDQLKESRKFILTHREPGIVGTKELINHLGSYSGDGKDNKALPPKSEEPTEGDQNGGNADA